jgi:hypothetical protein
LRLKIVSDGTVAGTRLIDEETGQKISNVKKITWTAEAPVNHDDNQLCAAVVELAFVPVDLSARVLPRATPKIPVADVKHLIDAGTYERAGGGCICTHCGRTYLEHPEVEGGALNQLCDGRLVHL